VSGEKYENNCKIVPEGMAEHGLSEIRTKTAANSALVAQIMTSYCLIAKSEDKQIRTVLNDLVMKYEEIEQLQDIDQALGRN
jgi:hypothetical protein